VNDAVVDQLLAAGDRAVAETLRRAGDATAECIVRSSAELGAKVRMGKPESVEEATTRSLGLRVWRDGCAAMVSTNDFSAVGIARAVSAALDILELAEPDPFGAPVEAPQTTDPRALPDLDLLDPDVATLGPQDALARATEIEAAALRFDPRIASTDGASFKRALSAVGFVFSTGFRCGYAMSTVSAGVIPVAADGGRKRRGAHWSTARHLSDVMGLAAIGEEAARKTLAKLGARSVPTCRVPVVFHPDAARVLLRGLSQCFLGGSARRGSSYLAKREGTRVASELVTIVDDPLLARGPASRPFDGEGIASRRNVVVADGVLESFLCDSHSARHLGRETTANAARGTSGGLRAATSNFVLLPGTCSADEQLRTTGRGLYVTDLIGYGFHPLTGDFSRGAAGFWIEGGALAFPVHEVTVAGNFDELWQRIDAVGTDLKLRTATESPTFRVAELTVAGCS
jgi:PmbA protein